MSKIYTPESAMAIVAHPDDIEFGSAGTLARWANAGCRNCYVLLTSGDVGINDPTISREEAVEIREEETQEAARIAGAAEVVFIREPDGLLQPTLELRERLVREFVAEFRGLSGSAKQKQVLDTTGLARLPLSALVAGDDLDHEKVAALLTALQAASKPVQPKGLGIIGKVHLEARCEALGAEMESFSYGKQIGTRGGLPWVIETAFAWRGEDSFEDRTLITGVNWSAGLINPFRQLGRLGESLDTVLAEQRVHRRDPVIFVLHAACPRVAYSDRGKSAVVLGG